MNQEAFQHRSGRVISLARLSLAVVFLFAIWADPSQPSRYPAAAYAVLAAYLAASAAYLAATWNNWWLEHRLAVIAHCFDIALFGLMVYLTEGYTSPFFTFFVFIILASTIRWGWRETAATAAAVVLLFYIGGFAATTWGGANFEISRFIIRGTYLLVLSLLLIWFGLNQKERFLRHLPGAELNNAEQSGSPPIRLGLEQAAARTGARGATLVWWEQEEPWLHLARLEHGAVSEERHPPGHFGDLVARRVAGGTFIFDSKAGRALVRRAGSVERLANIPTPLDPRLAAQIGSDSGLVIPVQTGTHGALFVLEDIPGLCTDDLEIGERLGEEFAAALQRASTQSISEQAAASRTRLSLARDLHDSVAQLLAGTSLRLEALRQAIRSGKAVDQELETLQQELRAEQRDLRRMIGELRDGGSARRGVSLSQSLSHTLDRLSRQWGVTCKLERCPDHAGAGARLQHNLRQLIREAIANAVKHGRASEVGVAVELAHSQLSLTVRDNGSGFTIDASDGTAVQPAPWSLNERIHEMGGTLMLASTPLGSEITMSLPWRPNS